MPYNKDDHARQYLSDFRMLANVLFALCMFASVLNIEFTSSQMSEPDLLALLRNNATALGNFVVAFVFLAMYWVKFVGKLHYTVRTDTWMLMLWLAYLAVVCLYPCAENLLGNFPGSVVAQIFFSSLWAVIGIIGILNWWYANYANLIDEKMSDSDSRRLMYESFPEPVFALISVPFALYSDFAYYAVMLMIVPANLYIAKKFPD